MIDEATNKVTHTIPIGDIPGHNFPYGVAVDPAAGTVYVTNLYPGTVSVIAEATNKVTHTIPMGAPYGVAVDPAAPHRLRYQQLRWHRVGDRRGHQQGRPTPLPIGIGLSGVAVDPLRCPHRVRDQRQLS